MDSEKIGYANTSQVHSLPTQQYDNQKNLQDTKEATFKGLNVTHPKIRQKQLLHKTILH